MRNSDPASRLPATCRLIMRAGRSRIRDTTTARSESPERLMCAYYDLGGEGVAYHYTHQKNPGSGELNPLNGDYYNEFSHDEAVGISYTKFGNKADNSPYNKVTPPDKLFYVGWTEAGEWFNLNRRCRPGGHLQSRSSLHFQSRAA